MTPAAPIKSADKKGWGLVRFSLNDFGTLKQLCPKSAPAPHGYSPPRIIGYTKLSLLTSIRSYDLNFSTDSLPQAETLMGPWLLVIGNLGFALLCVGLVFSLLVRKPAAWKRGLLRLIPIGFLLFYIALAGWDVYVYSNTFVSLGLRQHLMIGFLLIGYLLGLVIVWRRARRERLSEETQETEPAARSWSSGKLAWVTLLLLVGQCLLWWNLDSRAQQMLHVLQLEAKLKALELTPAKPADAENAAPVYEQAFALLPKEEPWRQIDNWRKALIDDPQNLQAQDPELIKFFEQQAPTLDLMYQAAELPVCQFELKSALPDDDRLEVIFQVRQAARLLELHAYLVASEGNLQAAMRDVQTIHRLAVHEGSGPQLVSLLISYAIDGMAQATLQELLSGQQPTTEELSPLEFEADYSRTLLLTNTFRMEKANGLAAFSKLFSDSDTQLGFARMIGLPDTSPEILNFPLLSFYRIFLLEEDLQAYHLAIDKFEKIAALPYPTAAQQAKAMRISMEKKQHGIMTQMLIPSLESTIHASARSAARHYTTQTGVAVHRFRAVEGKLPQTLEELVPKYLPAVPLDPFDEQPLRWKITGDEWIVYSIGENLQDDGGKPSEYTSYPPGGDICFFSRVPPEEPANEGQP